MSSLNRRAIVRGAATLPAIAALPVAAVANAAPDPIFAAIARHRAAYAAWMAAIEIEVGTEVATSSAFEAEFEAEQKASKDLVGTPPTTLPGLLALLRHIIVHEEDVAILGLDETPRGKDFLKSLATALENIQPAG